MAISTGQPAAAMIPPAMGGRTRMPRLPLLLFALTGTRGAQPTHD